MPEPLKSHVGVAVSPKEAARLLSVSVITIRRMIHSQQIEAIRVRGQWRCFLASLRKVGVDRQALR